MDIITIALIEKHIGIPFDVVRYLNEFVKYDKITNESIYDAIDMWFNNKQLCIFRYNHISLWDVSNVVNMFGLFYEKITFDEDISKWNVSNVNNMSGMFYNAKSFNGDISKWDVSNVKYMNGMFYGSILFNNDISKWDVSNVQNAHFMFYDTQITMQHINNWNMSQKLKNCAFKN